MDHDLSVSNGEDLVTLRALAEARLRKSEARLAEAEEIAGLGSWEWDPVTDHVQWSAGMYRIVGVDPATFTPTYETYFALIHPADRTQIPALTKDAVEDGAPVMLTHRMVRPDGVERITEARSRSIVDDAGNVVRLVGTVQDVTDAMGARGELDRVSRYNEALLDSAGEGICGLTVDGTVTFANPAALRAMGLDIGELRGRDLHSTIQHSRPDGSPYAAQDSPILASLRDGAVHRCDDDVFWRGDGTCFPVDYTSTPLLEHGAITGAVILFKDISDRRAVERVKDELTSVVSHELRTPLASVRGALGLLESGALSGSPEKARRMIEIAVQNTDRVVRLINDILDVDHLNSGSIRMNPQACDAAQLVQDAAAALMASADCGERHARDPDPAARGPRRCRPDRSDADEPDRQRDQVLRTGHDRHGRRAGPRRRSALRGQRRGAGRPAGQARGDLRTLRAGRCIRLTHEGRQRPRSDDLPRDRHAARRPHLGAEPGRRGRHVRLHAADSTRAAMTMRSRP